MQQQSLEEAALALRQSAAREAEARARFKDVLQHTTDLAEQRAQDAHSLYHGGHGGVPTATAPAEAETLDAAADVTVVDSSWERLAPDTISGAVMSGDVRLARLEEEVRRLQLLSGRSASQLQRMEARVHAADREAHELRNAMGLAQVQRHHEEARYETLVEELEFVRSACAQLLDFACRYPLCTRALAQEDAHIVPAPPQVCRRAAKKRG